MSNRTLSKKPTYAEVVSRGSPPPRSRQVKLSSPPPSTQPRKGSDRAPNDDAVDSHTVGDRRVRSSAPAVKSTSAASNARDNAARCASYFIPFLPDLTCLIFREGQGGHDSGDEGLSSGEDA